MRNAKYTSSETFQCLENLHPSSLDIALVHTGKEQCLPYHIYSGIRSEYIIHFVLAGTGAYSVNGNTWSLQAGQMFLIFPGEPVTYSADETTPWSYTWIGFNGIRANTIIRQCGFSRNRRFLPAPEQNLFIECIEQMLEHRTLTLSDDLAREAYLLMLFSRLIQNHDMLSKKVIANGTNVYSTNVYVELAIEYIQNMYKNGVNVSDIAEYIGISRTYLNHAFQKELGLSVQKFLIDYRMHKAADLLVSTSLSVKEIAGQVGYNDALTFSKAFKKKFEAAPQNYRTHIEKTNRKRTNRTPLPPPPQAAEGPGFPHSCSLIPALQHPVQDICKRLHGILDLLNCVGLCSGLQQEGLGTQMQIIPESRQINSPV